VGHDAEGHLIARVPRILPRIRRTRRGRFQIRLPAEERGLLRRLAAELRELLGTDDPALARLYPPGHASDPETDEQYRELVRGDLTAQRLAGLQVLERTVDASDLDEEEVGSWLAVLNDMRLVLGTRLDVTEEMNEQGLPPGDPRAELFEVYRYLTWFQWQVVEAMAAGLPETGA
jgi:uncharacterized protein DUF2017